MTPTQRVFAAVVAIVFFLFVLDAIRRRRLEIQYAVLWLLIAVGIGVLAVWYDALVWLTGLIGAVLPTTTLFLFGILVLVAINIQFSMRISQLQTRLRLLSQEHALLEQRLEKHASEEEPAVG
ncbi:MAG: DUF2304 domain-containing protein [Candidatus Lernaella stagnicola]|nr:DUF2304 domain-containing protein [Candidatus Lernaella stagnicola]